ncbi:hypothetical protein J6590_063617 [Homalodisca vitripennis]|nr:hypothetical protein J6590_063617 [Homalodisca vitripennis]
MYPVNLDDRARVCDHVCQTRIWKDGVNSCQIMHGCETTCDRRGSVKYYRWPVRGWGGLNARSCTGVLSMACAGMGWTHARSCMGVRPHVTDEDLLSIIDGLCEDGVDSMPDHARVYYRWPVRGWGGLNATSCTGVRPRVTDENLLGIVDGLCEDGVDSMPDHARVLSMACAGMGWTQYATSCTGVRPRVTDENLLGIVDGLCEDGVDSMPDHARNLLGIIDGLCGDGVDSCQIMHGCETTCDRRGSVKYYRWPVRGWGGLSARSCTGVRPRVTDEDLLGIIDGLAALPLPHPHRPLQVARRDSASLHAAPVDHGRII